MSASAKSLLYTLTFLTLNLALVLGESNSTNSTDFTTVKTRFTKTQVADETYGELARVEDLSIVSCAMKCTRTTSCLALEHCYSTGCPCILYANHSDVGGSEVPSSSITVSFPPFYSKYTVHE